MAYFPDLSEYAYLELFERPGTRNVGWLAAGQEFDRAEPDAAALTRLWDFCKVSVGQTRGLHLCELCSDDSFFVERNGENLLVGSSEIRVFSPDGAIFAAPTLIYHYMKSHQYKPPDEFLRALHEGPAPPGEPYFDRLRELGLQWGKTSSPAVKPVPMRPTPRGNK